MTLRRLLLTAIVAPLALASACFSDTACSKCQDIVTTVPWSAPETHTYTLKQDGKDKGTTTLAVEKDGDRFVLKQISRDDKGNSDESSVTADGATLKPITSTRTIVDSSLRKVAESSYEAVDKEKCSSGQIVRIQQSAYEPPSDTTPDSTRSNPLCVPDHSYDNNSALFLWRTIKFEKGYTILYRTVLADRRDTQTLTLRVRDQVKLATPSGDVDAWMVDIEAGTGTQRAWFATTPDHRILRYDNGGLVFEIEE